MYQVIQSLQKDNTSLTLSCIEAGRLLWELEAEGVGFDVEVGGGMVDVMYTSAE